MTSVELRNRTVRDLASMAKKKKVPGWHAMTKDELVRALVRRARTSEPRPTNGNGHKEKPSAPRNVASERLAQIHAKIAEAKDLAFRSVTEETEAPKDRLIVMVRDPYWLHAYWELSRKAIERAKVALGQHWHIAQPVLRLYEVPRDGTTTSARHPVRDIDIHGGVKNWYIDVNHPPKSYQLDIGYRAMDKFYCLARSNVVTTPAATEGDAFDRNWAEVAKDCDRIFALSGGYSQPEANGELKEVLEERLQRPVGDPAGLQFGPGASGDDSDAASLDFQVDTELIVHGVTDPDAHVTLRGEPVPLRSDGSFAVRFNLPDRRHVLPVVASSRDGARQRTIVLAVDRNTKVMEPVSHDVGE